MTEAEERYVIWKKVLLEEAKRRMGASEIGLRFCDRDAHAICTLCDDGAEPGQTEFFLESTGGLVCFWCASHLAPLNIYDAHWKANTQKKWTAQ